MIRTLEVVNITKENFGDYGQWITNKQADPKMKKEIFTFWDNCGEMNNQAKIGFGFLEVVERDKEFTNLERHQETEEAFFAMDSDVLVLVGKATPNQDKPQLESVKAFRLEAKDGVLLKRGTWHAIPYPLSKKAKLLVIFKQGTPDNDLEVRNIEGVTFRIDI